MSTEPLSAPCCHRCSGVIVLRLVLKLQLKAEYCLGYALSYQRLVRCVPLWLLFYQLLLHFMPAVGCALHVLMTGVGQATVFFFFFVRCAWSQSSSPLQVLRVDEILWSPYLPPLREHHSRCASPFSKGFQADVSHIVVAVVHCGLALTSRSLAGQANAL